MGRFETTASTYERFREPYPAEFFAAIAKRLNLVGRERLIDLGTGPGVIALGLAPYVGSVFGVDPEPTMLAEARANAERRGIALSLFAGRTEDLPADHGRFDIISIGRALHWMDRAATLAVLERILAQDGVILIIGSRSDTSGRNPWYETLESMLRSWNPTAQRGWNHIYEPWFNETPFGAGDRITYAFEQPVTPEDLFNRALTRSSTSAAILGERLDDCRAALHAALAPFFPEGVRSESLTATAWVIRRR